MSERNTIEKITCPCGIVFEWENTAMECFGRSWADILRPKHCGSCQEDIDRENEKAKSLQSEREAAERIAASIQRVNGMLDDWTPARYRATDTQHPDFNLELWNQVKTWRPSAGIPWLGLIGESGASKTRIAFLLLREIVIESIGRQGSPAMSFAVAASYQLAAAVKDQHSRRMADSGGTYNNMTVGERALEYLKSMARSGILLLDDLGKAKNTPTVAAELFAIIDRRHAENLPMIWTANSLPAEIVSGMSADVAGPLVGRLIDCSEIINV